MSKKTGRPLKKIDWKTAESLAGIQCTGEEIASVLNIDYDTLERRIRQEFKISFTDWFKKHSAKGKVSLRRRQFRSAIDDGSVPMQIWLGKQYLGQSDKIESENTNTNINAFEVVEYDED